MSRDVQTSLFEEAQFFQVESLRGILEESLHLPEFLHSEYVQPEGEGEAPKSLIVQKNSRKTIHLSTDLGLALCYSSLSLTSGIHRLSLRLDFVKGLIRLGVAEYQRKNSSGFVDLWTLGSDGKSCVNSRTPCEKDCEPPCTGFQTGDLITIVADVEPRRIKVLVNGREYVNFQIGKLEEAHYWKFIATGPKGEARTLKATPLPPSFVETSPLLPLAPLATAPPKN